MFATFYSYVLIGASVVLAVPTHDAALHVKSDDGIVMSVSVDSLTMSDNDGRNIHTYLIDSSVKVTLNGGPARVTDLVKGEIVRVGINGGNQIVAVIAMRSP